MGIIFAGVMYYVYMLLYLCSKNEVIGQRSGVA